jgi:hypothetical protein
LRDKRPVRAFQLSDRTVAIEPDHEEITEFFGALQIANMAEVNQIETSVGGDDPLATAAR